MTLPSPKICRRIRQLFRLTGSPNENESAVARKKLGKVLLENGLSWNDIPAIVAAEGMSRPAWYRRNKARRDSETTSSAVSLIGNADRPVLPETGMEASERCVAPKQEDLRLESADGASLTADIPISVVPCWVFGRRPQKLARAA